MKKFLIRFLGWTVLLDLPLFMGLGLLILVFNAYIRYQPLSPHFDLFLMHVLYHEFDDPAYRIVSNPKAEEKLEIEWIIDEESLRSFQYPKMTIINRGGAFYAQSRDYKDNYWIHSNYITYRGEEIDTTWDGMWCGTGIFNQKINAGEKIEYTWFYSLFEKISMPYYSKREKPTNPEVDIRETFGDSTEIFWTLTTFSTPWSPYVPQIVKSPSFMLYPDELITTWNALVGVRRTSPALSQFEKAMSKAELR